MANANNTIYQRVVARLYNNANYGKGAGPKRINQFIFNGAIELPGHPTGKCFVDLPDLQHLRNGVDPRSYNNLAPALTGLAEALGYSSGEEEDYLAGQLMLVKPTRYLLGGLVLSLRSWQAYIFLGSDPRVCEELTFSACPAAKPGIKSPDYFAANFDLSGLGSGASVRARPTAPPAPQRSNL